MSSIKHKEKGQTYRSKEEEQRQKQVTDLLKRETNMGSEIRSKGKAKQHIYKFGEEKRSFQKERFREKMKDQDRRRRICLVFF